MSLSWSSSSSSGSETEEIFHVEMVDLCSFVPYEEDLEPLVTAEEAAEQEARMAEELEEEGRFQARFTREVDVSTWYEKCTCSNCSVQLTTKPEGCQCCKEIDRCGEVMESFGDSERCITLHSGFQDVCLNRHVLEIAALGLKTKSGKSYRMLFDQGPRSEAESVAYRQFTRLLWDFTGSSRRYPLPCCAYTKIRKQFPDENGQYHGFEDDDEDA